MARITALNAAPIIDNFKRILREKILAICNEEEAAAVKNIHERISLEAMRMAVDISLMSSPFSDGNSIMVAVETKEEK